MDILAYFGGILGLLTGFSFISAVEILYIFVLKPIYSYIRNMQRLSICHKRSSKVSPFDAVEEQDPSFFKNYLQESSIHSLNYIANEQSILERFVTSPSPKNIDFYVEMVHLQVFLVHYFSFLYGWTFTNGIQYNNDVQF